MEVAATSRRLFCLQAAEWMHRRMAKLGKSSPCQPLHHINHNTVMSVSRQQD